MTTGALDLPDTGRLELDDAKDELRKVLRAGRHGPILAGDDTLHLNRSSRRGTARVVNLTVT